MYIYMYLEANQKLLYLIKLPIVNPIFSIFLAAFNKLSIELFYFLGIARYVLNSFLEAGTVEPR